MQHKSYSATSLFISLALNFLLQGSRANAEVYKHRYTVHTDKVLVERNILSTGTRFLISRKDKYLLEKLVSDRLSSAQTQFNYSTDDQETRQNFENKELSISLNILEKHYLADLLEIDTDTEVPPEAIELIVSWEKFESEAFPDPLTGGEPWMIGYGSPYLSNREKVKRGDVITEEQAKLLLGRDLEENFLPHLKKIPYFDEMSNYQKAALFSFAFDVGANFYGANNFDTITRTLENKDWDNMRNALTPYRNPGTNVENELLERRNAEADMWFTDSEEENLSSTTHTTQDIDNQVIQVTESTFRENVLESELPVLVVFCQPSCSHCQSMENIIKNIEYSYDGIAKIVKVNVYENIELANMHRIRSLPTLILFNDGEKIDILVESVSKSYLENLLNQHIQDLSQ